MEDAYKLKLIELFSKFSPDELIDTILIASVLLGECKPVDFGVYGSDKTTVIIGQREITPLLLKWGKDQSEKLLKHDAALGFDATLFRWESPEGDNISD